MITFVAPERGLNAFTCPYCSVYTSHAWGDLAINSGDYELNNKKMPMSVSICINCNAYTYWLQDRIVEPESSIAPLPNADLPDDLRDDYLEARDIVSRSPRGAAALLRLIIQKLCVHLGEDGRNINDNIGSLVRTGRIEPRIQRALDSVRVIGNDAVHPGELDLRDNPNLAIILFDLVNMIVQETIAKDKKLEEIYQQLPKAKRDGIARRDLSSPF